MRLEETRRAKGIKKIVDVIPVLVQLLRAKIVRFLIKA